MSDQFTIYGLRLKGDKEVRYIGQTNGHLETRLRAHLTRSPSYNTQPLLTEWLLANAGNVEVFAIGKTDTRTEALAMEKAIIALCLRLEHRLLNRRSLPAEWYSQPGRANRAKADHLASSLTGEGVAHAPGATPVIPERVP